MRPIFGYSEIMQINLEEESRIKNRLDEMEIISAYNRAQELYKSGSLQQRKQLLNLYLKRINVFPEYVQIHLHKIPSNLKKPSCEDTLPTNDNVAELYNFLITPICRRALSRSNQSNLSRLNQGGTGENLVRTFLGDSTETPANTRALWASQTTMFTNPS